MLERRGWRVRRRRRGLRRRLRIWRIGRRWRRIGNDGGRGHGRGGDGGGGHRDHGEDGISRPWSNGHDRGRRGLHGVGRVCHCRCLSRRMKGSRRGLPGLHGLHGFCGVGRVCRGRCLNRMTKKRSLNWTSWRLKRSGRGGFLDRRATIALFLLLVQVHP